MSIFINYRRNDVNGMAGRIYDRLVNDFDVFLDTAKREENLGNEFPTRLKGSIEASSIFLTLFGDKSCDEFKARKNKDDWVKEEIEYAKKLNKKIIPILIGINDIPKCLPKSLHFLFSKDNYIVRHDYFDNDIKLLKETLKKIIMKEEKNITTEINFNDVEKILVLAGEQGISKMEGSIDEGYELWQSEDDFDARYFLSIFKQKFNTATRIESFDFEKIRNIRILHLKNDDISTISNVLKQNNVKTKLYTYNQFISEKCIGNRLPKLNENYFEEKYYIEQNLYEYSHDLIHNLLETRNEKSVGLSEEIISNFLISNTKKPLMMILANPGAGKTTFINHFLASTKREKYKGKYYITIYAEKLKGKQIDFYKDNRISSIYDLYKVYTNANISMGLPIEEELFNIGLASGNIVIIIEGLDEILSLFPNRFDINIFFESLIRLNKDFGECKVITTSRLAGWENSSILENDYISAYVLKGFNSEQINLYLEKRYGKQEKKIVTLKKKIEYYGCTMDTKIPFLISLLCQIEDELEENELYDTNDNIPYLNFGEPFDRIFYYDIQREKVRQSYEIDASEIVNILKLIAIRFGKAVAKEDIINSDICTPETFKKIEKIRYVQSIDIFKFSSDFIYNYLVELFFIEFFSNKNSYLSIDDKILSKLITLDRGVGPIQESIVKYFQKENRITIFMENARNIIYTLINLLNDETIKKDTTEWKFRKNEKIGHIQYAMSAILYLAMNIHGETTRDEKLNIIKKLYSVPPNTNELNHIYINGAFFEVNFENLEIKNSLFDGYDNFANSINNKTRFTKVEFQNMEKITGLTRENFPELEKQFTDCDLHCLKNNSYFKEKDSNDDLRNIIAKLLSEKYKISKDEKHTLTKMKCLKEIVLEKELDNSYEYTLKIKYEERVRSFYNNGITFPTISNILYCLKNK